MAFKESSSAIAVDNIVNGEDVEATIANRPHDQAFVNTDQLASVLNSDRNLVIRGGGTISWNSGTETLSFSETLYLSMPNENISTGIGGAVEHTIVSGSLDFSPGTGSRKTLAAIKVSRTAEPGYTMGDVQLFASMTALEAAIAAESPADQTARFDYIILAKRELISLPPNPNDHIILWDGRRVRDGESITNSGATDTQYAQDSEFQAERVRENQDRNTYLLGGGVLTWEGPTFGLKLDADFYLSMPNNVLMRIASGTLAAIDNDQCYIIHVSGVPNLDRADDATTLVTVVPRALNHSEVEKDNDNLLVLGICRGDRLYLMDGTVVEDGFRTRLGGLAQGVRWVFSGPGTGSASYDFGAVGGSIIRPTGADPEFFPGATELMVYVNGVRYVEGRYGHPSGAGNGDYDEPADTTTQYTTITWTPTNRPVPSVDDWVVAFVGLAVPNLGPTGLDQLALSQSDGTVIKSVDLSTDDVREDDATDPTVTFSDIPSGAEMSVGGVIADPVAGRRAQGVGAIDHGALLAYSQRPQVFFDDTDAGSDNLVISPGELALPLDSSRETWVVHRIWLPAQVDGNLVSPPTQPGGLVYVYIDGPGTRHDSAFGPTNIEKSTTPPIGLANTNLKWLAHPSNLDWIYIGCYYAYTGIGPVFDYIRPFDRVGDEVRYRAGHQPQVLSDNNGGGGWGSGGGQIGPVDLSEDVPRTAHGVILQVEFDIDMAAYDTGGGTDITGVAFYSSESTPPLSFPSSIADDHDVQYLVQPLAAATSGTKRYAFDPFIIPVNNLTGGAPDDASVSLWVGPYVEQVVLHVVGYVESQQHVYRHR